MDVSASFQFLVDCFERDWHVIAPDWRGFGLSAWARDGYWFPDYYADLDALLDLYQPDSPVNARRPQHGRQHRGHLRGAAPGAHRELVTLEGLGHARAPTPRPRPKRLVEWLDALHEPPRFSSRTPPSTSSRSA